jgi:hypothetical protein
LSKHTYTPAPRPDPAEGDPSTEVRSEGSRRPRRDAKAELERIVEEMRKVPQGKHSLRDVARLACAIMRMKVELSISARCIANYLLLGHYNVKFGNCNPKNKTIADALGIEIRTVQKGLAELRRHGVAVRMKSGHFFFRWSLLSQEATSDDDRGQDATVQDEKTQRGATDDAEHAEQAVGEDASGKVIDFASRRPRAEVVAPAPAPSAEPETIDASEVVTNDDDRLVERAVETGSLPPVQHLLRRMEQVIGGTREEQREFLTGAERGPLTRECREAGVGADDRQIAYFYGRVLGRCSHVDRDEFLGQMHTMMNRAKDDRPLACVLSLVEAELLEGDGPFEPRDLLIALRDARMRVEGIGEAFVQMKKAHPEVPDVSASSSPGVEGSS